MTNAAEAADAAGAGADIIDVKDPGAGSLARAPAEWVRAIRGVQSLDDLIRPPRSTIRMVAAGAASGVTVASAPSVSIAK